MRREKRVWGGCMKACTAEIQPSSNTGLSEQVGVKWVVSG